MKALILVVAMTALPAAQANAPAAGSWTAEFAGKTFVRLELKNANGAVAGGISVGDIELDKQGAIKKAGESPHSLTPIFDAAMRGPILTFARKDGRDTDRFELRVLDDGSAELTFVLDDASRKELAASGISEFKPIHLVKHLRP
jgi:hypothetical protein